MASLSASGISATSPKSSRASFPAWGPSVTCQHYHVSIIMIIIIVRTIIIIIIIIVIIIIIIMMMMMNVLSSSQRASYMQDKSCLSKAVCLAHLYKADHVSMPSFICLSVWVTCASAAYVSGLSAWGWDEWCACVRACVHACIRVYKMDA